MYFATYLTLLFKYYIFILLAAVYTIDALNGTTLKGKTIVVTPSTFTFNEVTVELCVPPRTFNMEIPLRRNFKEFGKILLIKVYEDMFSNTYGSIIFDSLQSAASAANELLRNEFALCNMYYGGKSLVDPQFPLDIVDPSTLFCPPKEQTSEGFNVRVDNLYFFVTDQYLLEQFSPYGKISFCEVEIVISLSVGVLSLYYFPYFSFEYIITQIGVLLGSRSCVNLILAMVLDVLHFQPAKKLWKLYITPPYLPPSLPLSPPSLPPPRFCN